jgi:hypothetical protein
MGFIDDGIGYVFCAGCSRFVKVTDCQVDHGYEKEKLQEQIFDRAAKKSAKARNVTRAAKQTHRDEIAKELQSLKDKLARLTDPKKGVKKYPNPKQHAKAVDKRKKQIANFDSKKRLRERQEEMLEDELKARIAKLDGHYSNTQLKDGWFMMHEEKIVPTRFAVNASINDFDNLHFTCVDCNKPGTKTNLSVLISSGVKPSAPLFHSMLSATGELGRSDSIIVGGRLPDGKGGWNLPGREGDPMTEDNYPHWAAFGPGGGRGWGQFIRFAVKHYADGTQNANLDMVKWRHKAKERIEEERRARVSTTKKVRMTPLGFGM